MTATQTWKRGVTLLVLLATGGGAAIWAQPKAETAGNLAAAQQEVAQAQTAADRGEAVGMVQMFKQQVDQAADLEQQLRGREADLSQALQAEDARWANLIGQLEQHIKK